MQLDLATLPASHVRDDQRDNSRSRNTNQSNNDLLPHEIRKRYTERAEKSTFFARSR